MAITSLASARAELQARGYQRFAAGRLDTWLNSAMHRFENYSYDWPWMRAQATVTSVPNSLVNCRRVLSVTDNSTGFPLQGWTLERVLDYGDGTLTLAGVPAVWYLDTSNFLSVYPLPATMSLTVTFIQGHATLSGDSDEPSIPREYQTSWVDLAEVEALRFGVKDMGTAAAMEQAVFARLGEIYRMYAMQDQSPDMEMFMTDASVDG